MSDLAGLKGSWNDLSNECIICQLTEIRCMPDAHFACCLQAAEGYLALNMPLEALEELERFEDGCQSADETIILRIEVLNRLERWDEVLLHCDGALAQNPRCSKLYLLCAPAVQHVKGTRAAIAFLEKGSFAMPENAEVAFALAHLLCEAKEFFDAKDYLMGAFDLDPALRSRAREEQAFERLWPWL